jgi:TolA-binding protein
VSDNEVGALAIVSIFVLFPIVIAIARKIWRQSNAPATHRNDDTSQQLRQMQQSIDAMAIEIERISEGQRFVTKVLAEREKATLPRGG